MFGIMMDVASPSTSTSLTPAETLFRLCQIWTVLHNRSAQMPTICKGVGSGSSDPVALEEFERYLRNNDLLIETDGSTERPPVIKMNKDLFEHDNKEIRINNYRYTTRSLSVIGVLGGIVLILLITALSACVRHRRNLLIPVYSSDNGHESFARQILVDQLRNLNRSRHSHAAREPPPSYDDVVKPPEAGSSSEADPPSYLEATASVLAATSAATLASTLGSSASMASNLSSNALASQEEAPSTSVEIEDTNASEDDVQVTVNGRKVGQTVVQISEDEISATNVTNDEHLTAREN